MTGLRSQTADRLTLVFLRAATLIIAAAAAPSDAWGDEHHAQAPDAGGPFCVAAVQYNPQLGILDANVSELAARFEDAARQGAKIIVAPEMATTGYLYRDREDIAAVVETIPGPTTRRFQTIAERHDCYLVWGMPERDAKTDLFYNSVAIVGPEGLTGRYRKTHLWESEAHWAAWGNLGVPVFDTPYGRVAVLICQDANYVETFRLAALQGADMVCFATNSSGQTIGHLQARALQNGVAVISANRSDSEIDRYNGKPFRMQGSSAVWSPQGKLLAEASTDGEETVFAEIDPAQFSARRTQLAQRKPQWYKPLARHVAPWNLRATTEPRAIEAVAVQYRPAPGQVTQNRRCVECLLASRLAGSCPPTDAARLIVLPELSLAGRVSPERMTGIAEPPDGPTLRWAAALAKRWHAFVVCGFPERSGDALFNSAAVLAPDGQRLGVARKRHLSPFDKAWASPGDEWTLIRNEQLGRLGVLVGNDSQIAESGTVMAIQRADVVAVPASWQGGPDADGAIAMNAAIHPHAERSAKVLWDDMAWTHQYWVVVSNVPRGSRAGGGGSGIYSTDPIYGIESPGLARTHQTEVVVGRFRTLNGDFPDHWISQHHYIGSRRPGTLYYPLLAPVERPQSATARAPQSLVP